MQSLTTCAYFFLLRRRIFHIFDHVFGCLLSYTNDKRVDFLVAHVTEMLVLIKILTH